MKTILTYSHCLIIALVAVVFPKEALSQYDSIYRFIRSIDIPFDTSGDFEESQNTLTYNLHNWGENNEGITPTEVLFIESFNRIYVYGARGVLVYNPDLMEVETIIPISDYGQYSKVTALQNFGGNRMAFNGDYLLYCFTNSFELKVIDLQYNSVIESYTLEEFSYSDQFERSILKYDSKNNTLFLTVSGPGVYSHCFRFNLANPANYYHTFIHKDIRDFEISDSPVSNCLFASYTEYDGYGLRYIFRVFDYNFFPLSGIPEFEAEKPYGHIEYIYEPQNNIHIAICFPAFPEGTPHSAFIYDGDSYSKTILPLATNHRNVTATIYHSSEQKVYYCYNDASSDGIGKLDLNTYSVQDINLSISYRDYISDFCITGDKIFLGKEDMIVCVNNSPPYNWSSYAYFDDYILSIATTTSHVFAANLENCSIEIFSDSGSFINSILLGGACLKGVYNAVYNKLYMYNPAITDDSQKLFIKDLNSSLNSSITIDNFGYGYIAGVISDELRNCIYVSIASNPFGPDAEILMIDPETNTVLPNSYIIPGNVCCRGIYMTNDKLYCAIEDYVNPGTAISKVYIIDLLNPSNTYVLTPSQPMLLGQLNVSFEEDENNNVIIALNVNDHPGHGRLIHIDYLSNAITYTYAITDPYSISYDSGSQKIFFTQSNSSPDLGIIDLINQGVTYLDLSNYYCTRLVKTLNIKDQKQVCILAHYNSTYYTNSKILWLDPLTNNIMDYITVSHTVLSINYNEMKGEIYTFYPRGTYNKQYLGIIPRSSHTNTLQVLLHGQRSIGSSSYLENDIFFNDDKKGLFIPNNFFSDFYQVELPTDNITLLPETINWISFPRLDRDNNDPVLVQPVLENIDPFPDHLSMTNLPPQEEEEISIEYTNNQWIVSGLTHIQSTRGYKLETSNTELSFLPMEGTQLDPAYPISIYEGYENWVGYYPTWQQDPFDALAEVLDELTLIKHHDWACVKEWGYIPPDGNLKPYWICCSKKSLKLKYADMIVLETMDDVTFQWGNGSSGTNQDLLSTEYFSFDEKPDYTPIFIDLDSTDNPVEIGAFIADSCIGASVVEEGDTLVMIRGYMPEDTAGEITFEEYNGATKSASGSIGDYYVLNTDRHVREKRIIHSGENKKYYHVSFRNDNSGIDMINPLILSVYPNPCQDHSRIDYFIPESSRVEFEIIDVFGRKVSETLTGDMAAGHYTMLLEEMNTNSLSPSIYLVRMSACGKTAIKRILINR